MALSSVDIIIDRVRSAEIISPIAVFLKSTSGKALLDAVFASTVETRRRINNDKHGVFVGTFNKQMDDEVVGHCLNEAIKNQNQRFNDL